MRRTSWKAAPQTLVAGLLAAQTALTFWLGEALFRLQGRRSAVPDAPGEAPPILNVLVVRLDEIGDMVMCTPFLRELRRRLPDAYVTLVVKPGVQALFEFCPYVNEVLVFEFHYREPSILRALLLPGRTLRFAARCLWARRYDLAFLPRWDTDYYYATFLAYWSGARRRVGFSEKVSEKKRWANRGFDRLLTEALTDVAARHETERPFLLLEGLGAPPSGAAPDDRQELWVGPADRDAAERLLAEAGVGAEEMLIGIGPSGGHSVLKQWPLENFALLGRRLQDEHGARIVLFGGPDEAALGRTLAAQIGPGVINLVGRTSLRQMAAVMARCRLYVGNDSGPTHVAAAMGVPVVAIFGSSCPHRFHPGENTSLVWHELPCSPCRVRGHEDRCHRCIFEAPRCLTGVTVEEVSAAASVRLSSPPRRLSLSERSFRV